MLNFLGIGSQKCGTTWLFDKLKMHPRLYFPVGKEGNYWNHRFYLDDVHRSLYHAAMNGPVVDLGQYCCGEMTPEYAIMPLEQIATLKKHHPDIQLFLMVRNPIDRAWSAIKMTYKYYKMDMSALTPERTVQSITTGKTAELGRYDQILQNWLTYFASEQLHILFFDDLATRYREILRNCCGRIGVAADFFDQIPDRLLIDPSMKGDRNLLSPAVYAACVDFYRPSVEFLSDYTGRDLTVWMQHSQFEPVIAQKCCTETAVRH